MNIKTNFRISQLSLIVSCALLAGCTDVKIDKEMAERDAAAQFEDMFSQVYALEKIKQTSSNDHENLLEREFEMVVKAKQTTAELLSKCVQNNGRQFFANEARDIEQTISDVLSLSEEFLRSDESINLVNVIKGIESGKFSDDNAELLKVSLAEFDQHKDIGFTNIKILNSNQEHLDLNFAESVALLCFKNLKSDLPALMHEAAATSTLKWKTNYEKNGNTWQLKDLQVQQLS